MGEDTKIFQRIKYMDNIIRNIRAVRVFLDQDVNDEKMKNLIDDLNREVRSSIDEVLSFAKEKRVTVRENHESTAYTISTDFFGFWINEPHRLSSKNYSRYDFSKHITDSLYSLRYWKQVSKPTKKGVVKCPNRISMELADYPVIDRFKDGDFKIQADKELFDLLTEIEEFYVSVDKWVNKNE